VPLTAFDQPAENWGEPTFPLTDAQNPTHTAIWNRFDVH